MALEDLFVREIEGGLNFVANRESGLWVLTEETDLSKLEILDVNPSFAKKHNGTAMVLLNVGRSCNLDCIYCHAGLKKTSEKMSREIGRKAVGVCLEVGRRIMMRVLRMS